VQALLILLLALVVLGFGFVLVTLRVNAGVRVGKSHLINPTDSPEEAHALGILIVEVVSKPPVLHVLDSERRLGRVWLEYRMHYESTWLGFAARQVIDPEILFIMTVERFSRVEKGFIHSPLRIDDQQPGVQWSSGLPGFVKVYLRWEGETPPAVTVSTGSDEVCLVIPKPGV
jgi:hypothetical protein